MFCNRLIAKSGGLRIEKTFQKMVRRVLREQKRGLYLQPLNG